MRWTAMAVVLALTPRAMAQEPAEATETPEQRYQELEKAYDEAAKAWWAEYESAAKAEDKEAIEKLMANRVEEDFVPKFWAAAEQYAGSEDAESFLVWVATHAFTDREKMQAAITALVDDHVASARLAPVASRIDSFAYTLGKDKAHAMLTRILEHNEHAEVRVNALMTRGEMYVGTRGAGATDEQRAQALADLREVAETAEDERLAERARGAIYEEEHLGIGKVAPDIVGEDLDGVEFKLSDYRGKVVMLDFWGDW